MKPNYEPIKDSRWNWKKNFKYIEFKHKKISMKIIRIKIDIQNKCHFLLNAQTKRNNLIKGYKK
jgi:hypothetical protein